MTRSVGMVMFTASSAIGTLINLISLIIQPGYAMAHLVEVLLYKPEGRGFDS